MLHELLGIVKEIAANGIFLLTVLFLTVLAIVTLYNGG